MTIDTTRQTQPVILYGIPFSQPVRAVLWLLLYKGLRFRLMPVNPGSRNDGGSRSPAYLEKNPGGTIPTIEEPDTGFTLGESHAILCYLSNRHQWHDVYPADPHQRARVDWYLHYHHRSVREGSIGLVAPLIRKDLKIPEAIQQSSQAQFGRALRVLDTGWLARSTHLCGDGPTLADFSAYAEIGQFQPEFTNLFDFGPYPNLLRWMDAMKRLPGHDLAHRVLAELGDISGDAPAIESIRDANLQAIRALAESGAGT